MNSKKSIFDKISDHFGYYVIAAFWLFALLNPFFKKYDYGAGYPLLLLFCILLPFLYLFFRKKKRDNISRWEFWGLTVFAFFYLVSFMTSSAAHFGLSEVLAYLSMVTMYFLLANKHLDWMNKFLKVVFWGLLISVLLGVLIYVYLPQMRFYGSFFNLFSAANVWPNGFALFVLMAWPTAFFVFRNKNYNWLIVSLALIGTAFFLSFSRGAAIALGGQLLLLGIYYLRRLDKTFFLNLIALVILGTAFFQGINQWRAQQHVTIDLGERVTFAEGTTSADERLDFWRSSVDFVKEKPLLGWGPFSFRYVYNAEQTTFFGNSDHVHNLFLKIAMENGLIALSGLLVFGLAWFVNIARGFKVLERREKDELAWLMVAIAGAVAHSLIDYNFNFFVNLMLFFVLLAFARSYVKVKKGLKGAWAWSSGFHFSIILAVFAIYEMLIFGLIQMGFEDLSKYTLYPRDYYIYEAEEILEEGDFVKGQRLIDKQLSLSPIDSRAYYLLAQSDCKLGAWQLCKENYETAIEMNPLNDLNFYADYLEAVLANRAKISDDREVDTVIALAANRLKEIRPIIVSNTHFVAYTEQVEAAEKIGELLLDERWVQIGFLSPKEREEIFEVTDDILQMSEYYRKLKTY